MTITSLPRRLLVGATASALLLGGGAVSLLGSASAAAPTKGCNTRTDPAGDALVGGAVAEPDLDLTGLVLGSSSTELTSVLRVTKLQSAPDTAVGHSFYTYFTVDKHVIALVSTAFSPSALGAPVDALATATAGSPAQRSPLTRMTVDGTYVPSGLKAAYDTTASTVTFTIPRKDLAAASGTPFADGTVLTALYGRDATSLAPAVGGLFVDSTAPDNATGTVAADTWTVGDNACFGDAATPPPATTPPSTPPSTTPPPATTGPSLYAVPRKGCVQFTDPTGDAAPLPMQNSDDLDITSVVSRTTATTLDTFVHVTKLGASPGTPFNGHQFDLAFTVGGKAVTLSATKAGPATSTVAGAAKDLKATAAFDTASSNVVFSTPLADLGAAAGDAVTAETAKTTALASVMGTGAESRNADSAAATTDAQKTYTVGDNTCFLPPAGLLTIDADPSAQHTDKTELFATLTDADETPVEGATVTVALGDGTAVAALTDADGVADVVLPVTALAGPTALKATFAGSDTVGAVTTTRGFVVALEKTVLTAKAGRGTVIATVKDDDKSVVAGQPVTFTVGKKVTTVTTSAKGVALLKGLTKGASVKVGFAAVAKTYAAARSVTVRAL